LLSPCLSRKARNKVDVNAIKLPNTSDFDAGKDTVKQEKIAPIIVIATCIKIKRLYSGCMAYFQPTL
jgi:hypothetical protein